MMNNKIGDKLDYECPECEKKGFTLKKIKFFYECDCGMCMDMTCD